MDLHFRYFGSFQIAIALVCLSVLPLSGMPRGRYRLHRAPQALQKNLIFVFGKDSIRSILKKETRLDALILEQRNGSAEMRTGSIQGLVYKKGEYLYGRLKLPGVAKDFRCKLWQKGSVVYLRVYGPYTWHTWELRPVRARDSLKIERNFAK